MMQNSAANSAELAADDENKTITVNEPVISTKDINSAPIDYEVV